jgi:hypothetical protein
MDTLPDFVTERDCEAPRRFRAYARTGWESVVFQLDAEPEPEPGSELSTAAFAP